MTFTLTATAFTVAVNGRALPLRCRSRRAPAKKPPARKVATKRSALPEALAKAGKAAHDQRIARLASKGRDAIARVKERQATTASVLSYLEG